MEVWVFGAFAAIIVTVFTLMYNALMVGDVIFGKGFGLFLLLYFAIVGNVAKGRWTNYLVGFPSLVVAALAVILWVRWGAITGPLYPVALYFSIQGKKKIEAMEAQLKREREERSQKLK